MVSPAFLIAGAQDVAEEMESAIKGKKSYSLREVQRNVQAEREAAIRRKLEAAARFRQGTVSAEYFAACIKDAALENWQPVYAWEKRTRPSNFSRTLLINAGIDPDSVTSEAHARKVMQAVGVRRYKRLAEIRDLAGLDGDDLWTLTKQQAQSRRAA